MVKQYHQHQSCKQEEGSWRVKKATGLNRELIHVTGEKQPEYRVWNLRLELDVIILKWVFKTNHNLHMFGGDK